jgi:hypothetical protein
MAYMSDYIAGIYEALSPMEFGQADWTTVTVGVSGVPSDESRRESVWRCAYCEGVSAASHSSCPGCGAPRP